MVRQRWAEICQYLGDVWGDLPTARQVEAGWALVKELPDKVVETAVMQLAAQGRERRPSMSVVYRAAADLLTHGVGLALPPSPEAESLTPEAHAVAMAELRNLNTQEQERRAKVAVVATRGCAERVRLLFDLLDEAEARQLEPEAWDALLHERTAAIRRSRSA